MIFIYALLLLLIKTNSVAAIYNDICLQDLGKLFNLNNSTQNEFTYMKTNEDDKFFLNICGTSKKCHNINVSVCKFNKMNQSQALGLLYKYSFSVEDKQLVYKTDKKYQTIINFKCNRHLKNSIINYLPQIQQGKKYHFVIEGFNFCIKNPLKCSMYNISNNWYDLHHLINSSGNWAIKQIGTNFRIILNLCDDLHIGKNYVKNECSYPATKICLKNNDTFINLGVFPTDLVITETGFRMSFIGGSLCSRSQEISSTIDFVCSLNVTDPILMSHSSCQYNFIWHTPAACEFKYTVNSNCTLGNYFYNNDILLRSSNQKQQKLNNAVMKYNICGVLHNCGNHKNTSFCLLQGANELIFGFYNNTVITKDTDVYMKLYGDICSLNGIPRSTNIQFLCDDENEREEIVISDDLCTANVTVYTKKLCLDYDDHAVCEIKVKELSAPISLAPLRLKYRNYEVIDPDDSKKVYLINVCKPLVLNSNSICPAADSAVCLRNDIIPNKYKRFTTLGSYSETDGLIIKNETLMIHFLGSEICNEGSAVVYETTIQFKCLNNDNYSIKLISKSNCNFIFLWETKYACIHKNQIMDIYKIKSSEIINTSVEISNIVNNTSDVIIKTSSELAIKECNFSEENDFFIYIPMNKTITDELSINKCNFQNHTQKTFNMHDLQGTKNIISKNGKKFHINICQKFTNEFCSTNLTTFAIKTKTIQMEFDKSILCRTGPFQPTINLRCSEKLESILVVKEEECSIEFDWYNSAFCSFFKLSSNNQVEKIVESSGVTIAVSIVISIIILIASIFGFMYYKKKRNYNSISNEYECPRRSLNKDFSKIV